MTAKIDDLAAPDERVEGTGSAVNENKILFVHILRGIAPILVVVCHLGGWWILEKQQTSWLYEGWRDWIVIPLRLYQNGGHLGVVLFFLISGFVISHVALRESRSQFVTKRVFRIFPCLFVGIVLMALAAHAASVLDIGPIYGNYAKSSLDYFKTLFLVSYFFPTTNTALSITWSLFTEVIFYSLVAVFLPFLKKDHFYSTLILSVIVFAIIILFNFVLGFIHLTYWIIYLPLLIIGRAFYLHWSCRLTEQKVWSLVVLNFFVYCLLYESSWPGQLFIAPTEPFITYLWALVIFYTSMQIHISKVPKLFDFFANISYALYIVHLPVGMFILSVGNLLGLPFPAGFVLAVSASLIVAGAVTKWIDYPAQKSARHLLLARERARKTLLQDESTCNHRAAPQ